MIGCTCLKVEDSSNLFQCGMCLRGGNPFYLQLIPFPATGQSVRLRYERPGIALRQRQCHPILPAKKHSQPLIERVSEPPHSSDLHWLTAERDSYLYPYRGWEFGDLYLHSPVHFNSMMLKAGKRYVILKKRAISTVKATRELLYTEWRLWALLAVIRMISGNHTRSIYRNNVVTFNACYCNCRGEL